MTLPWRKYCLKTRQHRVHFLRSMWNTQPSPGHTHVCCNSCGSTFVGTAFWSGAVPGEVLLEALADRFPLLKPGIDPWCVQLGLLGHLSAQAVPCSLALLGFSAVTQSTSRQQGGCWLMYSYPCADAVERSNHDDCYFVQRNVYRPHKDTNAAALIYKMGIWFIPACGTDWPDLVASFPSCSATSSFEFTLLS